MRSGREVGFGDKILGNIFRRAMGRSPTRTERNRFSPSSLDVVWFDLELRVAEISATRFFWRRENTEIPEIPEQTEGIRFRALFRLFSYFRLFRTSTMSHQQFSIRGIHSI